MPSSSAQTAAGGKDVPADVDNMWDDSSSECKEQANQHKPGKGKGAARPASGTAKIGSKRAKSQPPKKKKVPGKHHKPGRTVGAQKKR